MEREGTGTDGAAGITKGDGMNARQQLIEIIRAAIHEDGGYSLSDQDEQEVAEIIADAIIAAGWPHD